MWPPLPDLCGSLVLVAQTRLLFWLQHDTVHHLCSSFNTEQPQFLLSVLMTLLDLIRCNIHSYSFLCTDQLLFDSQHLLRNALIKKKLKQLQILHKSPNFHIICYTVFTEFFKLKPCSVCPYLDISLHFSNALWWPAPSECYSQVHQFFIHFVYFSDRLLWWLVRWNIWFGVMLFGL